MTLFLLISAIILIACVIGSKLSTRFGVPTLLFLLVLVCSSALMVYFKFILKIILSPKNLFCRSHFHHVLRWLWYKMENCSSYS